MRVSPILQSDEYIVLDIETTGTSVPKRVVDVGKTCLSPSEKNVDEILQLAIVDSKGETLFYDSFRPRFKTAWPDAQRIHGITSKDVEAKSLFRERVQEVQSILDSAYFAVAYNVNFDLSFLHAQGIDLVGKPCVCVMREFAKVFGKRRRYGRGYEWQSLITCARYYGVNMTGAHDSLVDARTTLGCYRMLLKEGDYRVQPKPWTP